MTARFVATGLIVLVALLAYQAEPITGTIGWVVVALLSLSLFGSFVRRK